MNGFTPPKLEQRLQFALQRANELLLSRGGFPGRISHISFMAEGTLAIVSVTFDDGYTRSSFLAADFLVPDAIVECAIRTHLIARHPAMEGNTAETYFLGPYPFEEYAGMSNDDMEPGDYEDEPADEGPRLGPNGKPLS